MKKNKYYFQYGSNLFPSNLGKFKGDMNKMVGVKGGINTIRHMIVSTLNARPNITTKKYYLTLNY
jgi:hypothetical protein